MLCKTCDWQTNQGNKSIIFFWDDRCTVNTRRHVFIHVGNISELFILTQGMIFHCSKWNPGWLKRTFVLKNQIGWFFAPNLKPVFHLSARLIAFVSEVTLRCCNALVAAEHAYTKLCTKNTKLNTRTQKPLNTKLLSTGSFNSSSGYSIVAKPVAVNLFLPRFSLNCCLSFQAHFDLNKLEKEMHLLVNSMIKLSTVYCRSHKSLRPSWKFINAPLGGASLPPS